MTTVDDILVALLVLASFASGASFGAFFMYAHQKTKNEKENKQP